MQLPTTSQARRLESSIRGLNPSNISRESYKINGDLAVLFGALEGITTEVRGTEENADRWRNAQGSIVFQAPNYLKSVDAALGILEYLKANNHSIGRTAQPQMLAAIADVSDFTDKGFNYQNALALSLVCRILEKLSL